MVENKIIDGKEIASKLREKIKILGEEFKNQTSITPGLAVVLVGENPASKVYVKNKIKQTEEVGFNSYEYKLDQSVKETELLDLISELNLNSKVNGILVQLPLPKHINSEKILDSILPEKDVDGFHATNVGKLWGGRDTLVPCTPLGCSIMLNKLFNDLSGKNAVVIGRSDIVGKPMASLLLQKNATVTIVHSRTKEIEKICKAADILVAAVGVPEMVKRSWVKKDAIVIDVGINRIEKEGKNKLVGDVDFDDVLNVVSKITPVPGGVGPMTIACLLLNTLNASLSQKSLPGVKLSSLF